MVKITSKPLNKTIEIDRLIGSSKSGISGPTIIFTGGIHGNEPSGVFALHQIFSEFNEKGIKLDKGSFYGIAGNLPALERGERFHKKDLNRLWTSERMKLLENNELSFDNDDTQQQIEIYAAIKLIMDNEEGPFYFIDLHTTSSNTMPFLTVNDSLLNRKYTEQYPVPMILGIEEYLDGPLLSFVNKLGNIAFGYEAGQHDDIKAIENNVSFIYLSLFYTGCLNKNESDFIKHYDRLWQTCKQVKGIFEIIYRHNLNSFDSFEMNSGFVNFQRIEKGENLAKQNNKALNSPLRGLIFMPLYQSKGSDGYFIVHKIRPIFLYFSEVLRKIRADKLLPISPGIKWASDKKDVLIVNLKLARFFSKQIFHLFGYRSKND